MLLSQCGILANLISIASTFISPLQRKSISVASFLQCLHLHQLWLAILICSWSLVSFSWLSLPHVFFCSGSNWNAWKMVEQKYSMSIELSSEKSLSSLNINLTSYCWYFFHWIKIYLFNKIRKKLLVKHHWIHLQKKSLVRSF